MKLFLLAYLVATAFAVPLPFEDDDGGPVEFIVNGVAEGEPLELGSVLGIQVNEHVDGVAASSTNLLHPLTAVGIAEAAAADAVADDSLDVVIPEPVVLPSPAVPEVVVPKPIVLPFPVASEIVIPEPVVLPAPPKPEVIFQVIPEPVVLPAPASPEVAFPVIPEPVVLPAPASPEVAFPVIPEPVVLPAPAKPEVVLPIIPEPVVLPAPASPEVAFPVVPEPVVLPAPAKPEVVLPIIPEPVMLPAPASPEIVVPEAADVPVAAAQSPNNEVFNNGVVQVSVNAPQEAGVFSTLQSWLNFVINYFNEDGQTTHQII